MPNLGIAIVNWNAITSLGIGPSAFAGQTTINTDLKHPLNECPADFPTDVEYRPAYFDVAGILGGKGVRTMDRTTALAVCTSKSLCEQYPQPSDVESEATGFVIGTSVGSIRSVSDFTRESLVQERPFLVNPALFPNTVMNCAAGQCGIWYKARSINATVAGGRFSGLLAFKYASLMLRRGYVNRLYTGSVEELCPQTAWAHSLLIRNARRHAVPLGEACAIFQLERIADVLARGEKPLAELMALKYGRYFDSFSGSETNPEKAVLECMTEALDQCDVPTSQVKFCCLCSTSDAVSAPVEREAVSRLFGEGIQVFGADLVERTGETYSATFSVAIGQLLTRLKTVAGPQVGMVLAVGEDGHVGCVVIQTISGIKESL